MESILIENTRCNSQCFTREYMSDGIWRLLQQWVYHRVQRMFDFIRGYDVTPTVGWNRNPLRGIDIYVYLRTKRNVLYMKTSISSFIYLSVSNEISDWGGLTALPLKCCHSASPLLCEIYWHREHDYTAHSCDHCSKVLSSLTRGKQSSIT